MDVNSIYNVVECDLRIEINHLTIDENNKMIDVRSKTISMSEEMVQIA